MIAGREVPHSAAPPVLAPVKKRPHQGRKRMVKVAIGIVLLLLIAGVAWGALRMYRNVAPATATVEVPTTRVKRSNLTMTVSARGALRGGNSEMMTAPLTGGGEMHITGLRKTGELVKAGETVVEFDASEQEYKVKEAQSDLAENKLKVEQAEAQAAADSEEARFALQKAESDVRLAQLDVRKNPTLPAIVAKQNILALQAMQDREVQLRRDVENRTATNSAAIAVQKAAVKKSEIELQTAQKNMTSLALRAKRPGYVAIKQNMSGNFFFSGMSLPDYQIGDSVRGGMAVAEIPDLSSWEVSAQFGELDRGHISPGQKVGINVIALPDRKFTGSIADLGGTTGSPWNRRFETKIHLDNPAPELRPGMSVQVLVTTDTLPNALWLPAQALFEAGNRTFVYVPGGNGFVAKDVTLVRRSESQVVISGLAEGQEVALSDPEQATRKKDVGSKGPALPK